MAPAVKWSALAAAALLVVGLTAIRQRGEEDRPISTTGQDVPDPATAGDPDAAMEHARHLLARYRAAGWNSDFRAIPLREWQLPDRHLAENPEMRGDMGSSYVVPDPVRSPHMREVAFYTDLYARRNISRYKGDRARSRPAGFYIVAFRNGDVKKVSVYDVRLAATPRGLEPVFPGMAAYDPGAPRLPWVEIAR